MANMILTIRHTPTPWFIAPQSDPAVRNDSERVIRSADRLAPLVTVHTTECPTYINSVQDDAAFIVRACNSHEMLCELAEKVSEYFGTTDAPLGNFAKMALKIARGE